VVLNFEYLLVINAVQILCGGVCSDGRDSLPTASTCGSVLMLPKYSRFVSPFFLPNARSSIVFFRQCERERQFVQ